MPVPAVNLRPIIERTRAQWEAHLNEMFGRGQFILGPQVAQFEKELASAFDAGHAVGVGNGTDAIALSLRASGAKGEVITSALTAPFTGIGILSAGCSPRFADVNPQTLQIDAGDAGNRVTRRTAAFVPVHLYGDTCELDRFASMARSLKKTLVQDACQAHGARFKGKPFTAYSPYVAYSFYPTKNLGCLGDGGAVLTPSTRIAKKLRELRDGGRRGGQITYVSGINSRLDEMQACYLRAFLPMIEEWNADRARIARLYDQALRDCPGITIVARSPDSVCHLYVIRARRRERLRRFLSEKGITTGVHYPVPLHLHPTYRDCGLKLGDLPHAEKACREILSLPLWPYLPEQSAEEVAERIRQFCSKGAALS
jgi:dTDP-3-amino-3,4,6-trideoxy-alpha-D-glucose transaminase